MSEMIELNENELEMIAGGQLVGGLNVQINVSVPTQIALATAVLTDNSYVSAQNDLKAAQLNAA